MGLAFGLAVPLSVFPRPAAAGSGAAPAPAEPAMDPTLERSYALYQEGLARFDTFDYEGAVELWTKAYAELPAQSDGIRNKLVYNIATAQQMAFDVDQDLGHLRRAVLLLQRYVESFKVLHQRTPETEVEVQRAEARIAELRQRIEHVEHGEPTPDRAAEPREPESIASPSHARYGSGEIDGIVWTTPAASEVDTDRLRRNRRLASEDRKTDTMLVGSYVALGVGGAATLAGGGTVLATRQSGARGAGWGMLGLGVVGLATGFTLLAIGLERRKRTRQASFAAAPVLGPATAGAAIAVRF